MHVHLIGVAGMGMGSLAGLLRAAGHRVTGSDSAFYPPMGEQLSSLGVETFVGYDPAHLDPRPDLVVIGNVCRRDNPEARAAIDDGMQYRSMPGALRELFLAPRRPLTVSSDQARAHASKRSLVVAGTHGKSTTSSVLAWITHAVGASPSFLVGAVLKNFDASFHLGRGGAFVIEGDEYDSAFFEKIPKFWSYRPFGAIITSLEYDHVDIYPSMVAYRDAFRGFVSRIDPEGVLVAHAKDPEVMSVAREAPCRIVRYGLEGDTSADGAPIEWVAAPIAPTGRLQPFELFVGGSLVGRFFSPLMGEHNLRNTVAAIALGAESLSLSAQGLASALREFKGVKRRQELVDEVNGIKIFDDFAHHPTAVAETLKAIRRHLSDGRLIAVFEPRSATACRRTHQTEYSLAFDSADHVIVAPVGRQGLSADEKLDVPAIVAALGTRNVSAETVTDGEGSVDRVVECVRRFARPGDTVVVLSNGAFGGIFTKLHAALEP